MPELPEVEVLVRHLRPLVRGRIIRGVRIGREKVLAPTSRRLFMRVLTGARIVELARRGKYLLFELATPTDPPGRTHLIGHLGMTGRMYLALKGTPLPKHTAVMLDLGAELFIFEDTRYFGRLTLDDRSVRALGPEPLAGDFTPEALRRGLSKSRQPVKVRLLDQTLVAGVGNIYASEALFRAGISPLRRGNQLSVAAVQRLWKAIRATLRQAIRGGSTVQLDYAGQSDGDGLFYFGRAQGAPDYYEERLRVYDRAGQPCYRCGGRIRRVVQAARSTYYCPACQSA